MTKKIPLDLLIVSATVIATILFVLVPPLNETFIRTLLGLVTVLFLPGYSLTCALFPKKKDLDEIERIALSFGLSIAVTPLLGLILNYTPFGIRLTPILITLCAFTIACTITAHIRRMKVDEKERFNPSFKCKIQMPEKKIDQILTIILICSILASITAVVYVIITPKQGEKFTEFYVLGPGGMAYDYPRNMQTGENTTVILGVVNHEYIQTGYLIQVLWENLTIKQIPIQLDHNQTFERNVTVAPIENGTQKLRFILYKENLTEAYRTLHLIIEVTTEV